MPNKPRTTNRPAAKPAAKPTAPVAAPALDFGSLTVDDTATMPSSGKRGVDLSATPFPAALASSWAARKTSRGREYGSVKAVTVPAASVTAVVRMLRTAAGQAGYGVRIVQGDPVNGSVKIAFRAQPKRATK